VEREGTARPPCRKGRRGRPAQTKSRNLLERLDRDRDAVLRFMTSPLAFFTNNSAERPVNAEGACEDIRRLQVGRDGGGILPYAGLY
jgi:hypothetical protein